MPLVSVIAAIYNVEKYVEICIKSITGQTYKDLEILLIDDGSGDASGEICDRYARTDGRIRVIHRQNGGIADVRNLGLAEATGSYLLYVDGDDYIAPDCVEHAVAAAEKYEADLVVFDFTEIEESTGRQDVWRMQVPRDRVIKADTNPGLLVASPSPCNKLYRRAFWEKTGLRYPTGRNYEDLTLTPQLILEAERVVYLDSSPLYYYILHDGSIMRSKDFGRSYRERKAAIEDILQYFQKQGVYDRFQEELEYLAFEQAFFVPTKEVLYYEPKSPWLEKFGAYVFRRFPQAAKNPYVREWLSPKDKLILWLIRRKLYGAVRMLSWLRKRADLLRRK